MKKITIAVCSILFLIKSLSAQEIDVAVGVGTILPGENYCAKLRADLLIENHFSVGVQTNFYADKFTTSGFVLEPNMRIYFNNVTDRNFLFHPLGFLLIGISFFIPLASLTPKARGRWGFGGR